MTPTLLVLNGPPAVGKSTLARRFADDHPSALRLDIDELREGIPDWRDDPHGSGIKARALAVGAARAHLSAGHDVVVAQLFGRTEPLVELEDLARECGATFCEVVLVADLDATLVHFVDRGGPHFADVMADPGGLDIVRALHARIDRTVAARPAAIVVQPVWGDPDATYELLLTAIRSVTDPNR